jgi:hypothetical protein
LIGDREEDVDEGESVAEETNEKSEEDEDEDDDDGLQRENHFVLACTREYVS